MAILYKVEGLGLWDAEAEKFVKESGPDDVVYEVGVDADSNRLEALKGVLEFEGYPTDKLTSESNELEIMISQNKDYLINMFILSSLDIEIPDEARARFEEIKNKISKVSKTATLNLLSV